LVAVNELKLAELFSLARFDNFIGTY
jgi:hypothetical protein